jgi:group I intron endonuclease
MDFPYPNLPGIYCFENKINQKVYIGKSINLRKRIKDHLNQLRADKDKCSYLQNAWNKYGESNFNIFVVAVCHEKDLLDSEIYYIKEYSSKRPNGYNLTDGGDGSTGYRHMQETIEKLKSIFKGRKPPRLGAILSDETKMKISNSHLGMTYSKESKLKMAKSRSGDKNYFFGKKRKNSSSTY